VFIEIGYLSIAGIGSEGMRNGVPLNPGNGQYPISNSHYGFHLAGPWGLFLKDATQILPQLVERPRGFEYKLRAGREDVSCNGDCPLGLSWDVFQGYAAVQ